MSSPSSARSTHEHLRVTPEEREQARAAALAVGVRPSEFIRNAVAERAQAVLADVGDDTLVVGLVLNPAELAKVDTVASKRGCTRAEVVREVLRTGSFDA